ncbi:MAG: sporulation protein YqfC [Firmicutes bacterium]|nr:sporulation protein YqfC [Bacillota bacterium]
MEGLKAVCDIFDIAYDAAGNVPRITILGEEEAYIENFMSLEEYKKDAVKLKCKNSVIAISGKDFNIKAIKESCILIRGKIEEVKFI